MVRTMLFQGKNASSILVGNIKIFCLFMVTKSNVQLKVFSYNKISLRLYEIFLKKLLIKLNIPFSIFNFPKKKKKITLLSSPHVFKKAREQFQQVSHSFLISFCKIKFLFLFNIVTINLPKTIKFKITFL